MDFKNIEQCSDTKIRLTANNFIRQLKDVYKKLENAYQIQRDTIDGARQHLEEQVSHGNFGAVSTFLDSHSQLVNANLDVFERLMDEATGTINDVDEFIKALNNQHISSAATKSLNGENESLNKIVEEMNALTQEDNELLRKYSIISINTIAEEMNALTQEDNELLENHSTITTQEAVALPIAIENNVDSTHTTGKKHKKKKKKNKENIEESATTVSKDDGDEEVNLNLPEVIKEDNVLELYDNQVSPITITQHDNQVVELPTESIQQDISSISYIQDENQDVAATITTKKSENKRKKKKKKNKENIEESVTTVPKDDEDEEANLNLPEVIKEDDDIDFSKPYDIAAVSNMQYSNVVSEGLVEHIEDISPNTLDNNNAWTIVDKKKQKKNNIDNQKALNLVDQENEIDNINSLIGKKEDIIEIIDNDNSSRHEEIIPKEIGLKEKSLIYPHIKASAHAFYRVVRDLRTEGVYQKHQTLDRNESDKTLDIFARIMDDTQITLCTATAVVGKEFLVATNTDSTVRQEEVLSVFKKFIKDSLGNGRNALITFAKKDMIDKVKSFENLRTQINKNFNSKAYLAPIPQTADEWWEAFMELDSRNYSKLQKENILEVVQPMLDIGRIMNGIINKTIDSRFVEAINNYGEINQQGCVYKPIKRKDGYIKPTPFTSLHAEMKLLDYLIEKVKDGTITQHEFVFGISKLSCAGCYITLETAGEIFKVHFSVPGTHGKFMPGWEVAFVLQDNQSLFDKLQNTICSAESPDKNYMSSFDEETIFNNLKKYQKELITKSYKNLNEAEIDLIKQEQILNRSLKTLKDTAINRDQLKTKFDQLDLLAKSQEALYNSLLSEDGTVKEQDVENILRENSKNLHKIWRQDRILTESESVKIQVTVGDILYENLTKKSNTEISIVEVERRINQNNQTTSTSKDAWNKFKSTIQKAIEHNEKVTTIISTKEFNQLLGDIHQIKTQLSKADMEFNILQARCDKISDKIESLKSLIDFVEHKDDSSVTSNNEAQSLLDFISTNIVDDSAEIATYPSNVDILEEQHEGASTLGDIFSQNMVVK